ncbi:hypothetical protein SUGI_0319420 [Cryptomeria japonica]|nr:hypothetical protein SUGI_0319420 [Cryptomeria japonica]
MIFIIDILNFPFLIDKRGTSGGSEVKIGPGAEQINKAPCSGIQVKSLLLQGNLTDETCLWTATNIYRQ